MEFEQEILCFSGKIINFLTQNLTGNTNNIQN